MRQSRARARLVRRVPFRVTSRISENRNGSPFAPVLPMGLPSAPGDCPSLAKKGVRAVSTDNAASTFARVFRVRGLDRVPQGALEAVSRDVAGALECPPVPKSTRLVPARNRAFAIAGNIICPFAGLLSNPSDGLEPSTPSLPSWGRGGKRGHARVLATTKAPQTDRIRRGGVTRAWTRVVGLMFAPRSHVV
jgi:hypothetical protein